MEKIIVDIHISNGVSHYRWDYIKCFFNDSEKIFNTNYSGLPKKSGDSGEDDNLSPFSQTEEYKEFWAEYYITEYLEKNHEN